MGLNECVDWEMNGWIGGDCAAGSRWMDEKWMKK